eukprot:GDKJ01028304.1.p1 GENE.GDKJ01028304.1~~GDKJ01028304.1.p1  ORF type:complete len:697 (-),score=157.91 GDKJ01028304.1:103-1968(-)
MNLTDMQFFSHFGASTLCKLADGDQVDHAVQVLSEKLVIDSDRSSAIDILAALAYRPSVFKKFLERIPEVPRFKSFSTVDWMGEILPNKGLAYFYPLLNLLIEAPFAIIAASESQFQTVVQTSLDVISNTPAADREVPYAFLKELCVGGGRWSMWQSNPQFEEYRALMITRLLENPKNSIKVVEVELKKVVDEDVERISSQRAKDERLEELKREKEAEIYEDSFRGRLKQVGSLFKQAVQSANEETVKFAKEEEVRKVQEEEELKMARKQLYEEEKKRKNKQLAPSTSLEKAQGEAESAQEEFKRLSKEDQEESLSETISTLFHTVTGGIAPRTVTEEEEAERKLAEELKKKKELDALISAPTARETEGRGSDFGGVIGYLYSNGSLREPGTWWIPKRVFGSAETHDIKRRGITLINRNCHETLTSSTAETVDKLSSVLKIANRDLTDSHGIVLVPTEKRVRLSPSLETKTMMRGAEMNILGGFWLGIAMKVGVVRSIWNLDWVARAAWGGAGLAARATFLEMIYRGCDMMVGVKAESVPLSLLTGAMSNAVMTMSLSAVVSADRSWRSAIWFLIARLLIDPTTDSYRSYYKETKVRSEEKVNKGKEEKSVKSEDTMSVKS